MLKKKAFSLIELSVVLILMGYVAVAVLRYSSAAEGPAECNAVTRAQLSDISGALQRYAQAHNRYPLPADRRLGESQANYGREASDLTQIDTVGGISLGSLPMLTLGLPMTYAADCWNNKFTYAVTTLHTAKADYLDTTIQGAITVNNTLNSVAMTEVAYAVISHGEDGLGAVARNYSGSDKQWCAAEQDMLRSVNCNAGGLVLAALPSPGKKDAPDYFDDLVIFGKRPLVAQAMQAKYHWGTTWARDQACHFATPVNGGKVYYVSPTGNNGFTGLDAANAVADLGPIRSLLKPGDVVHLLPGRYDLAVALALNGQSGTAGAPITLEGECEKTIVNGGTIPTVPQVKPAIYLGNGSHLVLRNMVIENPNSFAVYGEKITDTVITNVETRNAMSNGVWVNRADRITVSYVHVHDTVLENVNGIRETVYHDALWRQAIGLARTSNSVVEHCLVENNWGEGIDFIGSNGDAPDTGVGTAGETNNSARNNYVRNSFSVGLYFDQMRNSTFENNLVVMDDPAYYRGGKPAVGISIADEGAGIPRANDNITIKNNVVIGASKGIHYGAYGLGWGLHNAKIWNNTVINAGVDLAISAPKPGYSHSGNSISNNLFYSTASTGHSAAQVPVTSGISFSNNLWYGTSYGRAGVVSASDVLDQNPGFPATCNEGQTPECYRPAATSRTHGAGAANATLVGSDLSGKARAAAPTIGALESAP